MIATANYSDGPKAWLRYNDLVDRGLIRNRVTLKRWIDAGILPAPCKVGNTIMWPSTEIEAVEARIKASRNVVAAKKIEPEASARKFKISPGLAVWQAEGFAYRELQVRLPRGMTRQDVYDDPTCWVSIQGSRYGLRRLDEVRVLNFDETEIFKSIVLATDKGVTLSQPIYVGDLPPRASSQIPDNRPEKKRRKP